MAWNKERMPQRPCLAPIIAIEDESPAWCAGLEPGMALTHVNGVPLRDMIEWQWQSDGLEVEITTAEGDVAVLERDPGEDWGITFGDCIFDGITTCRNACSFCFMAMLPKDMRPALTLRDDDYRLSFMQGNFVTLTNVTEEDVDRIVSQHLSPLHLSLHAVTPEVRRQLMGRNADRGLEVAERLLDAGIELHTQLVVCPGINDGLELIRTLGWVEAHPGVLSVGIVPLGYTRFQDRFSSSFSDDPDAAAELIDMVREFQEDSRNDTRVTKYHVSDEFYLAAGYKFPPAEFYDGFPQYEDGIGMMRVFLDEWAEREPALKAAGEAHEGAPLTLLTGEGFAKVLGPLLRRTFAGGQVQMIAVHNEFFGGNVDVAGLLTAQDMVKALLEARPQGLVLVPAVAFNASKLTLDDKSLEDIAAASGCTLKASASVIDSLLEEL
ncbi:MAG: DUF512 domain-containing protein [Coriobacteriaceae bacterium]|nr:DUF512 domain-containing protein [Coriobacteriaceae bacterium]